LALCQPPASRVALEISCDGHAAMSKTASTNSRSRGGRHAGWVLALCALLACPASAFAGRYEDAAAAIGLGDYSNALATLRPLAQQGDARAQFSLGAMYRDGKGVLQDDHEAVRLFRLAGGQGNLMAIVNLAAMYENGRGVTQNYAEAMRLYRIAADRNFPVAQSNLGVMYLAGRGVPQDYAEGVRWFKLAAAQGNAGAQNNLGILTEKGMGVEANRAEALRLYKLAADQGDATAKGNYERLAATAPAAFAVKKASQHLEIPLRSAGGVLFVPVLINNTIELNFMLDSGASDVAIPADVVMTLMRAGTISEQDFLERKSYTLADGTRVPSQSFRIRSLKVGDRVLENVTGSVSPPKGALLLGQSFLGRFKSWSIDNSRHALVLE
jgi:TPR repeat protein